MFDDNNKKLLTINELFGLFDQPEDNGKFILDLNAAREERSEQILKNVVL